MLRTLICTTILSGTVGLCSKNNEFFNLIASCSICLASLHYGL